MKNVLAIIMTIFFVLASMGQSTDFGFSNKALKSKEFHDLKQAYNNYVTYSKTHNSQTAYQKKTLKNESIQETVLRYGLVSDSLLRIMKSKSKIFYSKYPRKDSIWTDEQIDEFKELLVN